MHEEVGLRALCMFRELHKLRAKTFARRKERDSDVYLIFQKHSTNASRGLF